MSIDVREYLMNLDNANLDRSEDGYLSDEQFKRVSSERRFYASADISRCKIGNNYFYIKRIAPFESQLNGVNEITLGHVYNDLGVNSAIAYPLFFENKHVFDNVGVITQDIAKLKGLECVEASKAIDYICNRFNGRRNCSSWAILKNPHAKSDLLEVMTEECYNRLINLHLLDNLLTSSDRHTGNFYLVKKKGGDKWEDVITIDQEFLGVVEYGGSGADAKEYIDYYVKTKHPMMMPLCIYKQNSHEHRLKDIKNLLYSGKLSKENIELLKKALEYDIVSAYDQQLNKYSINSNINDYYREVIARLWEYNQGELRILGE